jgi:hypothetical protein
MYTLDTLVHRLEMPRVDFIRMDVEGYEANILRGVEQTLRKFHPRLVIEVHVSLLGLQETVRMLKELEALGYQPRHLVERDYDYAWIRPAQPPYAKPLSIDGLLRAAVGEEALLAAFAALPADAEGK